MASLKGLRYVAFITVFGGVIAATLYPVIINPLLNPNEYKKMRKLHSWESFKK